ncbi:hypothetical protein OG393_33410 (plasmid) [Streptomyces sp. NBC_01216]|nr:hypothetical protein OG393_33410 [Streptomyces sp. NBC_01216]
MTMHRSLSPLNARRLWPSWTTVTRACRVSRQALVTALSTLATKEAVV